MTDIINSLNNLITDHVTGDYNIKLFDLNLIINIKYEYFNATKLCASAGKDFNDLKKLPIYKVLSDYLYSKKYKGEYIMFTISNNPETAGTYVCKELLLSIVSWAYTEYYLTFNDIVIDRARERLLGYDTTTCVINRKIDNLIDAILKKLEGSNTTESNTTAHNNTTESSIQYKLVHDKLDRILYQLEKQPRPYKK